MTVLDFTNTGGDPLSLDDLAQEQSSLISAIIAPLDDYAGVVIVSGCKFTVASGVYTWTAGVIYSPLDKGLYALAAGTSTPGGGNCLSWDFSTAANTAGDVNYQNGALVHNWINNVAQFLVITGSADITTTLRYYQALNPPALWEYIGDSGEPAFQNSWHNLGGYHPPARYKFTNTELELGGFIIGGSTGTNAFTLVKVIPKYDISVSVFNISGFTATVFIGGVSGGSPGNVSITFAGGGNISLDGIRVPLD